MGPDSTISVLIKMGNLNIELDTDRGTDIRRQYDIRRKPSTSQVMSKATRSWERVPEELLHSPQTHHPC